MKSQAERDTQTVTIATSLALLVGVILVGVAVLWLLDLTADLSSDAQGKVFISTLGGSYLLRHRRP